MNSSASDPSGESSRASGSPGALPLSGSSLNPVSCNQNRARRQGSAQPKVMLLMRTAMGATSRRRRHLRLRSVSQLQEARKPTSTRVSHLLSTQPIQTARDATAVSPTDPAGRSAYGTPADDRAKSTERERERENIWYATAADALHRGEPF